MSSDAFEASISSEEEGEDEFEPSIPSEEEEAEDEFLLELFAAGKLKAGLNVAKKQFANDVPKLDQILLKTSLDLPWIEKMDVVNNPAELAPELAIEMEEQKDLLKSGRSDSVSLNEFKRETLFHRQAQLAAIEGITRLKNQGIPTLRPDDYFAEMMKSDEHMQKVRRSLLEKQAGLQRSEKVKKIRQHKKIAKQKEVENTLRKQKEKRELNEEIKKYRKGMRSDLDFLEKGKSNRGNQSSKWKDENGDFKKKKTAKNFKQYKNFKSAKSFKKMGKKNMRPGKERRKNMKNKKR